MSSTLDDIEQEEEDIFGHLSCYDYIEPIDEDSTRSKALKQLAVSDDSPFARQGDNQAEMRRIRDERAAILSKETNEIRRQLEAVKNRLNELKGEPEAEKSSSQTVAQTTSSKRTPRQRSATIKTKVNSADEPKLRPLTGKADCPNCSCDRRNSVCGKCANLNSNYRQPVSSGARLKQGQVIQRDYVEDNRPIRPAPTTTQFGVNKLATVNKIVTTVDDKLVPNQVYTISKSLNEKRTKLAQAIDELQLMINKVREKDGRLDKERKLVQMYKEQWKYGPNIGGPKASSRERLNNKSSDHNRNYRSRLDPNLIRDSKSLLGFNHIEPGLKLRQYSKNPSIYRPTTARKTNDKLRSKSLESLRPARHGSDVTVKENAAGRVLVEKSVSEINLAPTNEDETKADLTASSSSSDNSVVDCRDLVAETTINQQDSQQEKEQQQQDNKEDRQEKMQKMSWIPVFGETEVKTFKRASKRKVQIMDLNEKSPASRLQSARSNPQMVRSNSTILKAPSGNIKSRAGQSQQDNRGNNNNRVVLEANKKLHMANNLLNMEKQDCANRNQLVINRTRQPPVRQNRTKQTTTSLLQETKETSKEIARLEELVTEQQKLLAKLVQQQEQQQRLVSPITVSCSSPCLHHLQPPPTIVPVQTTVKQGYNRVSTGNKTLISNMREKLSKTKIRLAKTLESEREKHQRLQLKVDSSLRKQSDLENENELLKQSLSKCIDTCLKDISNTFESLSATLTDTINKQPDEDETSATTTTTASQDSGSPFSNAAQLITDNRYLKQMRSHIETIEQQRRGIFDELSREKQKSNQLELQLKQSKIELDQLAEAKQRLESRMLNENCVTDNSNSLPLAPDEPVASTSKQQTDSTTNVTDDTYNSVELYRRFVESMSPDIESIRQERKLILNEFDNIKRMLSDINATEK